MVPPTPDSAAAFEELARLEASVTLQDLSLLKDNGLPVVIYGAGYVALNATKCLRTKGFRDIRLAVDGDYKTVIRPELQGMEILDSRKVDDCLQDYHLVLGFEKAKYNPSLFLAGKFSRAAGIYEEHYLGVLETDFFRSHFSEFRAVHQTLADSLSRSSMTAFMRAKLTRDATWMDPWVRTPQYFQTDILPWSGEEAFFDAGAYDGDTIRGLMALTGGRYAHIWAAEPDTANFNRLTAFIRERNLKNIECLNIGLGAEKGRASFSDGFETSSRLLEGAEGLIELNTIDNIVQGARQVTCLKMDIEGGELAALHGAAETIKKDRPKLIICAYHRADDLLALPAFIKTLAPEYKLYFRLHVPQVPQEAVLYAVV